MRTVDVSQLLDEGQWSAFQKLLIFGTAITIILDGVDNQLIGPTIPALMSEWGLPRGAFSNVLAAGPFGMMFGGAFGGTLGDRIGRRTALLLSVLSFAVVTLGISFVNGVTPLVVLRFLAGLGLGGAMPNAAALASEYAPRRNRPFAVTITIVCVPLGGMLAAYVAGRVIPVYGWRMLFALGGILPVVIGVILFKVLPESPKYLAGRRERWLELRGLLGRFGHQVPEDADFVESATGPKVKQRASVRELFTRDFRVSTIGLFGSFFFCLMSSYIIVSWLVTMLTQAGFSQPSASNMLAGSNLGGVAGAILAALVIQRFGSRVTMLSLSAMSVAVALILAVMPLDPNASLGLFVMVAVLGLLMNATQTTMYALAAHVYPTEIRGTGVGTAVAVGRVGHLLSAYVGDWALAGGPPMYFLSVAVTMAIVFGSLALVRRHIERTGTGTVPAPAKLGAPATH